MRRAIKKKITKHIDFYISLEEYEILQEKYKSSTCRSLSQFFRVILNNGPLTIKYRNVSGDDFLITAIGLKSEWNTIAKNVTQAVNHLLVSQDGYQLQQSICNLEAEVFTFQQKVDELKIIMHKIYLSCIRK